MKRALCILGSMDAGGAESILMKIYRRLDREKYQLDFAVTRPGFYDEEIKALGGKIFFIAPKTKGFFKNFFSVKKLVKQEKYEYVFRASQHSLSALELLAAKLGGAKNCTYYSSNANTTSGKRLGLIIHRLFIFLPKIYSDTKTAPSTEAAEFMFGKDCVKNGKAEILTNAVDLDVYGYSEEKRKKIRDELCVSDKFVVGHVGRFNQQKNHKKLLSIFSEIKKLKPDSVLMLVGKGELENDIKKQAEELNIKDSIIFTGVREDVPSLLSAADVFVFPSLYEGLPNVVIEAQAAGLSCFISDTVTREADITGLVKYLSLDLHDSEWAKEVTEGFNKERPNIRDVFKKNGYDIESAANKFTELVFGSGR